MILWLRGRSFSPFSRCAICVHQIETRGKAVQEPEVQFFDFRRRSATSRRISPNCPQNQRLPRNPPQPRNAPVSVFSAPYPSCASRRRQPGFLRLEGGKPPPSPPAILPDAHLTAAPCGLRRVDGVLERPSPPRCAGWRASRPRAGFPLAQLAGIAVPTSHRGPSRLSAWSHSPSAERDALGNPGATDRKLRRALLLIRDLALLRSGRASHVGHDEADAQFTWMPFDFGDDPAGPLSSLRPDR